MPWHITATSCHYQTRPARFDDILALGPVAHFFNGDCYYFAPGQTQHFGFSTPDAAVNNTANDFLRKFQQGWYHSSYQKMDAARRAGLIRLYWSPDDHGWGGSDWDHTRENACAGNNPIGVYASVTQADVLTHFRAGRDGHTQIIQQYFDNPVTTANNGNIPNAMVGTANASDYPIRYFYRDYGSEGVEGGNLIRVIKPEFTYYKHPIVATDNASKTMLGTAQKAWLYATMADAKAKGFKQIVMMSDKDLYNTMNDDGWKSYVTEMNEILGVIDTNDYPVVWVSGDRHSPHIALTRKTNGDAYDTFVMCGCPFTVDGRPQTFYPQCLELDNSNGAGCWAKISVDEERQLVRYSLMNMFTGIEWRGYDIPFGSRIPAI